MKRRPERSFLPVAFILFIACAVAFQHLSLMHWKESSATLFRRPASIPKVFDFSELQGTALEDAARKHLISDAKSIREKDRAGFYLGHFVTRNLDGKSALACDIYNRVSMTFLAEGMAMSGDRPSLTIDASCEVGDNVNQMEPIWIPIAEIMAQKPGNMELQLNSPKPITLKFQNIESTWPTYWILSELKIYNRTDGRSISVDNTTIYKLSSAPLSMTWVK